MEQWPQSMVPLIGSLTRILKVTHEEIRLYGHDVALEMHCERSNLWIHAHQMIPPTSKEEELAIIAFAAALQFVNLLFATGEVDNDPK